MRNFFNFFEKKDEGEEKRDFNLELKEIPSQKPVFTKKLPKLPQEICKEVLGFLDYESISKVRVVSN